MREDPVGRDVVRERREEGEDAEEEGKMESRKVAVAEDSSVLISMRVDDGGWKEESESDSERNSSWIRKEGTAARSVERGGRKRGSSRETSKTFLSGFLLQRSSNSGLSSGS